MTNTARRLHRKRLLLVEDDQRYIEDAKAPLSTKKSVPAQRLMFRPTMDALLGHHVRALSPIATLRGFARSHAGIQLEAKRCYIHTAFRSYR